MNRDEHFMSAALEEARKALASGEVPVGAVIVKNDRVISTGHNRRETGKNSLYHAEILAIDAACRVCGGWRLEECELFVTLEPCPMCAGAILNARIARVVFGASDSSAGACGSAVNLFSLPTFHPPEQKAGVLSEECTALLSDFFQNRRQQQSPSLPGIILEPLHILWEIAQTKDGQTSSLSLCSPEGKAVFDTLGQQYTLCLVIEDHQYNPEALLREQQLQDCFASIRYAGCSASEKAAAIRRTMRFRRIRRAVFVGTTEADRIAAETAGLPFVFFDTGTGRPKHFAHRIRKLEELPTVCEELLKSP